MTGRTPINSKLMTHHRTGGGDLPNTVSVLKHAQKKTLLVGANFPFPWWRQGGFTFEVHYKKTLISFRKPFISLSQHIMKISSREYTYSKM